jgi:hypothetical protein
MNDESKNELIWNEWTNILLAEYERRFVAIGTKIYGMIPARKILTVIFLQVKGFQVPVQGILPEAIRIIKEQDGISSCAKEFDTLAMMGHRIGIVENTAGLKQYLQDVHAVLKPEGQILLTSIDVSAANEPECQSKPALYRLQCQQPNLIGPFFAILRIKADILKSQADAENWKCEFIYRQDDNNYLARLSLSDIF